MFLTNVFCFFLGYLAYPYMNHIPFPRAQAIEMEVKEPTENDHRRLEYVKECQRYGFSRLQCENIWDGKPV